ncbi:MAG: sulfite exporter TauE/SafE family protein [Mobilitalea sp.]
MSSNIITKTLYITNMTCVNCENIIENTLSKTPGVVNATASYSQGTVVVVFDANIIGLEKIEKTLEKEDYYTRKENAPAVPSKVQTKGVDYSNVMGVILIFLAIYMIATHLGLTRIFSSFPIAKEGMGYGMLFLIGVLTSVHCIAMCGGICLSQCAPQKDASTNRFAALRPSLLYNVGRVISYTIIGGIIGAIGQVVSFSGAMKGVVQILAGIFMVIMGLNMLNIFPWLRKFNPRMPKIFARKIYAGRQSNSPLYIGLLNGLMPCGPLQAMQLYALSTSDPIKGAVSMFIFSVGTVPLMFTFGAISSFLTKKFTSKMMTASAVLVVFLGIFMFNNGVSVSGFELPNFSSGTAKSQNASQAVIEEGVQLITSGLSSGRYDPIVVQKGIPVRWTLKAEAGDLNGCNNSIIIQKYGIQKKLQIGDNIIEFTPEESGTVPFSCWMGMIRSKITVVDSLDSSENSSSSANNSSDDSASVDGLEDLNNLLDDIQIPTEQLAIAELKEDGTQAVKINFDNEGLSPAVVVVQRGVEANWNINAVDIDSSKSTLIFPIYGAILDVEDGENPINFIPEQDFSFSTSDNTIYGYVKVVDDIGNIDEAAIKKEVSEYRPSEDASFYENSGGSCCQ